MYHRRVYGKQRHGFELVRSNAAYRRHLKRPLTTIFLVTREPKLESAAHFFMNVASADRTSRNEGGTPLPPLTMSYVWPYASLPPCAGQTEGLPWYDISSRPVPVLMAFLRRLVDAEQPLSTGMKLRCLRGKEASAHFSTGISH